jgi:hypothetical protein
MTLPVIFHQSSRPRPPRRLAGRSRCRGDAATDRSLPRRAHAADRRRRPSPLTHAGWRPPAGCHSYSRIREGGSARTWRLKSPLWCTGSWSRSRAERGNGSWTFRQDLRSKSGPPRLSPTAADIGSRGSSLKSRVRRSVPAAHGGQSPRQLRFPLRDIHVNHLPPVDPVLAQRELRPRRVEPCLRAEQVRKAAAGHGDVVRV